VIAGLLLAAMVAVQSGEAPASPPAAEAAAAPLAAPSPPAAPARLILPKGTMVRLMVLKEVNSRDHRAGHKFVLRVDEEVKVGGATLIPVGAKAWGEVIDARGTGGAGQNGRLNARLLYVEAQGRQIPLEGERRAEGGGSAGQVVGAVVAFGIFGLLTKGNNATLKAGEILNGYTVEEASFDPPAVASAQ
jgi:hypothetical protein